MLRRWARWRPLAPVLHDYCRAWKKVWSDVELLHHTKVLGVESFALFAWLIRHQPAVLFSQNKLATNNQPAVLISQNEPAQATSQTNILLDYLGYGGARARGPHTWFLWPRAEKLPGGLAKSSVTAACSSPARVHGGRDDVRKRQSDREPKIETNEKTELGRTNEGFGSCFNIRC
jgi:hypothetical protein